MIITDASHLDHALTPDQIGFIADRFAAREAFFIETFELPEDLGTVPCGLHGPAVGDPPVVLGVTWAFRPGRQYPSRLVERTTRQTRTVTVIGGPHEGAPCILYTAFGGPLAPKEPADPTLSDADREKSVEFWQVHALSAEPR